MAAAVGKRVLVRRVIIRSAGLDLMLSRFFSPIRQARVFCGCGVLLEHVLGNFQGKVGSLSSNESLKSGLLEKVYFFL